MTKIKEKFSATNIIMIIDIVVSMAVVVGVIYLCKYLGIPMIKFM